MIAILLLFVVGAIVLIVPAISSAVARSVISRMDQHSSGSIDQSIVEARLTRIEQAIDAMATQIEKLSDHQRTLLGPATPQDKDQIN